MTIFLSLCLVISVALLIWIASIRRPVAASYSLFTPATSATVSKEVFRVGTYNIHRTRGTDGKKDVSRIAKTIDSADIVGLNEVEGSFYGFSEDQASLLGSELGLSSAFFPTQTRWLREDRGNGILSRAPICRTYSEPLVDSTGRRNRVLSRTQVLIGDVPVEVFTTHLSRRVDQDIQLETVLNRFCRYERAILLGDFNIFRSFPRFAEFLESNDATDAIAVGDDNDEKRIDWILTRGFDIIKTGIEPVGASDHPYYWVDLKLVT